MVRQAHHERKKTAHPERVEGLRALRASAVRYPNYYLPQRHKDKTTRGGSLQKIQIRSGKIFESIASIKNHGAELSDHRVIEGGVVGQDCNAIHRLKHIGC